MESGGKGGGKGGGGALPLLFHLFDVMNITLCGGKCA